MKRTLTLILATALVVAGIATTAPVADAQLTSPIKKYPTDKCVAGKQKTASKYCGQVLKAESKFAKDADATKRTASIAKAAGKLTGAYTKADTKAADKNGDCTETGLNGADTVTAIDAAVATAVATLGVGACPGDEAAALLKVAGKLCSGLVKADSKHMKKRGKDPLREKLGADKTKVTGKYDDKSTDAGACAAPLADAVQTDIETAATAIVEGTVVTDALVVDTWTQIVPANPVTYGDQELTTRCVFDTPWSMWARKGTVNKLVVFYDGGGACWDNLTCGFGGNECTEGATLGEACATNAECDSGPPDGLCEFVNDAVCTTEANDDPNLATTGLQNMVEANHPFEDWHQIFVPYCTCDVHWGFKKTIHNGIFPSVEAFHYGRVNAMFVEKYAREHFANPDQLFVTGSSAGAYGALMNAAWLHEIYPSSRFDVFGDAGMGVITENFLNNQLNGWGVLNTLPRFIPELDVETFGELTMSEVVLAGANYYQSRNSHYAQYTTNWDWNQTLFYNAMVQTDPGDLLDWRLSTCGWNEGMLVLNQELVDSPLPNVRTYIGAGSDHTVFPDDKLWTDSASHANGDLGTIELIEFVRDMTTEPPGANWKNAQCMGSECDHIGTHQDGSTDPLTVCP